MEEASVDPKVIWGVSIFIGVMLLAGIGRWLINLREDMQDAKASRAKMKSN